MSIPFYNPKKTYEENFRDGPFGDFVDGKIYRNKEKPEYGFFGSKVYLPFGIPAGPLLNGKYIKKALDKGFDVVVYKTVRTAKYPCNPWPNVIAVQINDDLTLSQASEGIIGDDNYQRPRLSITNSFGVPSYDPDLWQPDMADAVNYAFEGQVVVGSFQGTLKPGINKKDYIADFVLAARLVKETGVKILEVNLSCPNEGSTHLLCFDITTTKAVAYAIKNEIGDTPLIIKISYFEDDQALRSLINEVGGIVEGIAAINTIPAKVYDKNHQQALPGKNRLISGICGHAVKWAGLQMTKKLKNLRKEQKLNYFIIGVGGVTIPSDYLEYKNAGADAVMSATGAMWNPYLAQDIKEKYGKPN